MGAEVARRSTTDVEYMNRASDPVSTTLHIQANRRSALGTHNENKVMLKVESGESEEHEVIQ